MWKNFEKEQNGMKLTYIVNGKIVLPDSVVLDKVLAFDAKTKSHFLIKKRKGRNFHLKTASSCLYSCVFASGLKRSHNIRESARKVPTSAEVRNYVLSSVLICHLNHTQVFRIAPVGGVLAYRIKLTCAKRCGQAKYLHSIFGDVFHPNDNTVGKPCIRHLVQGVDRTGQILRHAHTKPLWVVA